eukprot:45948-Eustigmatos_ZCMA.PRE.1
MCVSAQLACCVVWGVLYFFKHDISSDTSTSFAAMAWRVPELKSAGTVAVHPLAGFEIYLAPSMSGPAVVTAGDEPPPR